MIIEKVIINTFGGLSKKEIDLKEGMNVIVGPNESGKSTIYNAIEHTLFTPSHLTPARLKKQMDRFLPVGGGDTIEVTICFKSLGSEYTLQRRWGASLLSSLTLPDGSILTDDDAIQEIIRECLQIPEGTCKTVMMTYQTGLSRTVRDIQEDTETLESLGDILRKTVMEMAGVSVDAFRAKIEASHESFFGRWDIGENYPEGNRGIENPWQKGAGTITQRFYEKERLRKALEDAAAYEKKLDEINKRISDHTGEVNKAESYVKNNKLLKEDAVKRRQIEAELKGLDLQYEKLEKINKDWPITESKVSERSKKISELEEKEKRLTKEKEEAESYQKEKTILDQYGRVETKKKVLEEASERIQKIRKLSDKDLKSIREAFDKKSRLEASLSAGKLSATFRPKNDTELDIQKGLDDKVQTKIKGGETLDFKANGRVLVSHPEWDLEVISGEVAYSRILAEYEEVKTEIENLLRKFKIKSLEEAEAVNASYKAELSSFEKANSNLEEELGELTYEDLKEKAKGFQVKKPERELAQILGERAEVNAEIKGLKGDLTEFQQKLHEYAEEFGDHHTLLERLTEVAGARKGKQKDLASLKPLPSDIEDVERFISEYEVTESRLKELKDDHNELIKERIQLEAKAPDRSVEEIERDFAEAEERFDGELRNGMAVKRIKQNMEVLLEEMDSATYKGLEKSVSELIQKMTGGRYKEVEMQESVPSGFHREDGVVMPYENLSTGVMDIIGIALRLGITKQFLGEKKEGFVIMDDPFVDLDPNRQSKAAEAIKNFAEDKQLILLTCHPSHAELLGGNRIELNE